MQGGDADEGRCCHPIYSCPPLGWQTAPHTSATNSWGKANSPSTESKPRASWATLGLSFATSTIVEAGEEERQGQRWARVQDGHLLPALPTHPARCRGCPCSSPAGRLPGGQLLPRRGWAGGKRPSGWVQGRGGTAQGPPGSHGALPMGAARVGTQQCTRWRCSAGFTQGHGDAHPHPGHGVSGRGLRVGGSLGGVLPPPPAWPGLAPAAAAFPSHWPLCPRLGTCCSASSAQSCLHPREGG